MRRCDLPRDTVERKDGMCRKPFATLLTFETGVEIDEVADVEGYVTARLTADYLSQLLLGYEGLVCLEYIVQESTCGYSVRPAEPIG